MNKNTKKRISLIGLIVLGVGAGVLVGVQALKRRKEDREESTASEKRKKPVATATRT